MSKYSKYYKGKFLISKIIVTLLALLVATLSFYGEITIAVAIPLLGIILLFFFIVDKNLRKNS